MSGFSVAAGVVPPVLLGRVEGGEGEGGRDQDEEDAGPEVWKKSVFSVDYRRLGVGFNKCVNPYGGVTHCELRLNAWNFWERAAVAFCVAGAEGPGRVRHGGRSVVSLRGARGRYRGCGQTKPTAPAFNFPGWCIPPDGHVIYVSAGSAIVMVGSSIKN